MADAPLASVITFGVRDFDAERGELVDESHVVLGLEEELRDREVGLGELLGRVPAVLGDRSRPWMRLGMGRDPDREVTE